MPVYDYHCKDCKASFVVRKQMSQLDSPTSCPECDSLETQRLISAVAIFSSGDNGKRRALAAASSCSSCGLAATGCTSCGSR